MSPDLTAAINWLIHLAREGVTVNAGPSLSATSGLSVTPVVFGGPMTKGNTATPDLSSTHSLYLITALISLLAASSLPVHANYSINYTHIFGASWQILCVLSPVHTHSAVPTGTHRPTHFWKSVFDPQ